MQHHSKIKAMLLVPAALMLAGCATNDEYASNDPCPPNHTLVCTEHMGQDQDCKCHSKATLRDVFDLRRSR